MAPPHQDPVQAFALRLDGNQAGDNQEGGHAVERGVEQRQFLNVHFAPLLKVSMSATRRFDASSLPSPAPS